MIVKKIPAKPTNRHAGSGRAKHVRDLVDYMRTPEKESPLQEYLVAYMASQGFEEGPERLIHIGARNFVCEDVNGQRAEMMAVAQAAVRSPNPIDHWLLSWREGEIPTDLQVDEAVAMFVEDLGLSDHQCIYAVHGDTHNRHAHIALNRYNADTGKVVKVNKGFFKNAGHMAVARLVDHFGWQAEAGARYVMSEGKPIFSDRALAKQEAGTPALRSGASAFEVRTGYRSAQRIAQEQALPLIQGVLSWKALHASLAKIGIAYDPVGTNGAVLVIDGEGVKASDVSRHATITKLEKRLGPFKTREPDLVIASRPPDSDRLPNAFRADEYLQRRKIWRATDKAERKHLGMKRPPDDLETWLHEVGDSYFAERWRNPNMPAGDECAFTGSENGRDQLALEIDGYRGVSCSDGIRYARPNEGTAFLDRGDTIVVVPGSDEALLAALRLAVLRFDGKVRVNGDKKVKRRTLELARRNGLEHHLINPEFTLLNKMSRGMALGEATNFTVTPDTHARRQAGIVEPAVDPRIGSKPRSTENPLQKFTRGPAKPALPLGNPRHRSNER